jgi:biotin carboxyl carrier protein
MMPRRRRVTLADGSAQTVEVGDPDLLDGSGKASPEGTNGAGSTAGPRQGPGRAIVGTVTPVDRDGRQRVEVVIEGWRFEATVEDEDRAELRDRARRDRAGTSTTDGPLEIRAIIPGRVVEVRIAVGDPVEAGQALLVVEAMKMQNELRTPQAGTVASLGVGAGSTVEIGDVLVVLR